MLGLPQPSPVRRNDECVEGGGRHPHFVGHDRRRELRGQRKREDDREHHRVAARMPRSPADEKYGALESIGYGSVIARAAHQCGR